jgi:colanic acid biosynthesis glycosyl transferase WcaI
MTSESARILVLAQSYPPDPSAGGQVLADACMALAERQNTVRVLTPDRGYDDPAQQFLRREHRDGVHVHRLPFCSFGKRRLALRVFAAMSFTAQALVRGLFGAKPDVVLVSTFPPTAPLAALIIAKVRRAALVYWIMDLNPDQAVALKRLSATSWSVRALNWMQRVVLARARDVVVLDRFMADRVRAKGATINRLTILPPWPLQSMVSVFERAANPFRVQQAFGDRRVVMYSGNHGPSHPLATILTAADQLRDDRRLVFAFVGGGVGKKDVDAIKGDAIRSLPYQPFATLHESLSAADVHVVTMGNEVVGINHPSKIYDALAAGRAILFIGPRDSHVADILTEHRVGWHLQQGDIAGVRQALEEIATIPAEELQAMGTRAAQVIERSFSRAALRAAFCDIVVPRTVQQASTQVRTS